MALPIMGNSRVLPSTNQAMLAVAIYLAFAVATYLYGWVNLLFAVTGLLVLAMLLFFLIRTTN